MNEMKLAVLQGMLGEILRILHNPGAKFPMQALAGTIGVHLEADRVLYLAKTRNGGLKSQCVWEKRPENKSLPELEYPVDFAREADSLAESGAIVCAPRAAAEGGGPVAAALADEKIASAVMLPLRNRERITGYVRIDYRQECALSGPAITFLTHLGMLLSNAQIHIDVEEQLNNARQICATVLDNVGIAIFAANRDDEIVFANHAFRKIFGESCLGRQLKECLPAGSSIMEADDYFADEALSGIKKPGSFEISIGNGSQWLLVNKEMLCWLDGQQACLGVCYDTTASKLYRESITRMAYQDHLTGLPNRYRCDADLKHAIENAEPGDRSGYVFFLDLDDFKIVNDCYGHDYGDGVLMAVASYLRELFAGNTHVYRFGGDEFVVIIPPASRKSVEYYLETMLERAKKPWVVEKKEFYCPFSIGIVEFRPGQEDVKSILKKADIAMYQTKKQGKNSYIYYTEGLDIATVRRSEMENMLRSAMENDFEGFEVFYQPYISTRTRQIVGAEALVRLRGPDGKLLLPANFISLSEYLGLIVPLGEHVLRKASELCRKINGTGLPNFSMTVNLSYRQFQPKFAVENLERVMRETGVNLSNMILSVSEGAAISEMESMLDICARLRECGVKIALDNFGAGNSTLIDMRKLPVDIIKVSSRYIASIDDDFTGYFVRMAADLCRRSGKTACVSGVETEEQFSFCKKRRIEIVQGFLFHQPGSVEALSAALG